MRELLKKEQLVTIVPQNFKDSNRGTVTEVNSDSFRMKMQYKLTGIDKNHVCDFYSNTENGYLYFESYIENVEENVLTIASPVKHRFLQRRKFTRIKFLEDIELKNGDLIHKARTLDLSAGGMKIRTEENIDISTEYDVEIKLSEEQIIKCKYSLIRVEKDNAGCYTISGQFKSLSNIDKMTLVQFCMKKDMENLTK